MVDVIKIRLNLGLLQTPVSKGEYFRGNTMTLEEKQIKTLKIRIEEELLKRIKEEAKKQDTDLSTYVRWCLRTGLYLEDLSQFLQSKIDEE
jgi:hypothetical protein